MSEAPDTITAADPSALPVSEVTAPQITETEPPEIAETAPKTFTQEELDKVFARRLAQAERKWQREQARRVAETPIVDPNADPYTEQLIAQRVAEEVAKREQQSTQSRFQEAHFEREETARDKYDDYDAVAHGVALTDVMVEAIVESDVGPDVAYYLGQNRAEARRIAQLTPIQQVAALGRIEAKLADAPPVARKTSSAPTPITPVTPNGNSRPYDTTDPRSIASMSTSEWIAAERQRQEKKLRGSR